MLPSSLLFITIDAAIVVRFTWRSYSSGSTRWRVLYGMVALAGRVAARDRRRSTRSRRCKWFALPDGARDRPALGRARRSSCCSPSACARPTCQGRSTAPRANVPPVPGSIPVRVGSFLVGSAFSFPLVHFAVHSRCRSTCSWPPTSGSSSSPNCWRSARWRWPRSCTSSGSAWPPSAGASRSRNACSARGPSRPSAGWRAWSPIEYAAAVKSLGAFVDRAIDTLGRRRSAARRGDEGRRAGAAGPPSSPTACGRSAGRIAGGPCRLDLDAAVSDLVPELRHTRRADACWSRTCRRASRPSP